ncbi:hypothetical protein DENSPDRAFT_748310, partial [Dentipellis sp. KUC8613]
PRKCRPHEVLWWNKRGKPAKTLPPISQPKVYMDPWLVWWKSLQPSYRIKGDGVPMDRAEKHDEWDQLLVGGVNGVYIIIITLSWILRSIQNLGDSGDSIAKKLRDEAQELVVDVSWVLDQLKVATPQLNESPGSKCQSNTTGRPRKRARHD